MRGVGDGVRSSHARGAVRTTAPPTRAFGDAVLRRGENQAPKTTSMDTGALFDRSARRVDSRGFISRRSAKRRTMTTVVSDATAAMTTIKSSSMVVNMLRTALYTVTYCRGTRWLDGSRLGCRARIDVLMV